MSARQRKQGSSAFDIIEDTVKGAEKKVENALTVFWNDLPSWQQDNHYIHSGYRPQSNSLKKSFGSLGYLHNESVNIYSHLLGGLAFCLAGAFLYTSIAPRYATASSADIAAFGCFFAGAAACLGMSGTYHSISNHSPTIAKFGNKLDYVGIVFLIWGSFVPSIYYGFYCHEHLQEIYWSMISTLGVGCAMVSIFEKFRTPEWRPYRAGMFVAMGLSALFPVLHGVMFYGINNMYDRIGLTWLVLQGVFYIIGAGLYASRFPERKWPGAFDIWGSSHQIFHILVVMAAASHLYGLLRAFDYNHRTMGLKC
ncbi:hemolysin-III related-domain-containing protein [Amylocarpus encephaloides]|uniref:Hemolysin-III related-domain-containing protein n=1 Tax=Amylocarpus encephaloides TaxID=45428 RepID=A0A9P8C5G3_9HELO|nr:hemolysin-III related-domain-containing protein [Amylocarpus encephaloides]